jgi:hypothetical protein
MFDNTERTLMETIRDASRMIRAGASATTKTSLSSQATVTRVEPIGIVEDVCLSLPWLDDLLHTSLSVYAAYYMQAALTMSQVGGVKVLRTLDQLHPNRGMDTYLETTENRPITRAAMQPIGHQYGANHDLMFSLETYGRKDAICTSMESKEVKVWTFNPKTNEYMGIISDIDKIQQRLKKQENRDRDEVTPYEDSPRIRSELHAALYEPSNLAVGRLIELEFKDAGKSVLIPIVCRLQMSPLPSKNIVDIMALTGEDTGVVERFHSARSGRIEWIRDFMLASDLLRKYRSTLLQETSGVYDEVVARTSRNHAASILTGRVSYNSASSVWIISQETAKRIAGRLGGKITDSRVRKQLFNNVSAFIVAITDEEYNRATFYYRDIETGTSVNAKTLKRPPKDGGIDIAEVFKAYTMGNSPTF